MTHSAKGHSVSSFKRGGAPGVKFKKGRKS